AACARRRDALSARRVPHLGGLAAGVRAARVPEAGATRSPAAGRAPGARRADAAAQRRRRRGRRRAWLSARRPAEAGRVGERGEGARKWGWGGGSGTKSLTA